MNENHSLIVSRMLNATPAHIWYSCSQANGLREWWGQPEGAVMPTIEVDFRVGGSLHFKVELASGDVIWGKAFYKEIVLFEKIVLENHNSNEKGDLLDSVEWPASKITLTIEDGEDGAKLTVLHEGIGEGEHRIEEYAGGWKQSLERLALDLINQ